MFNATLVVKAEVSPLVEEGETLKSEAQRPAKARTLASEYWGASGNGRNVVSLDYQLDCIETFLEGSQSVPLGVSMKVSPLTKRVGNLPGA